MNKDEYLSKIEFILIYFGFGIILFFQYRRTFSGEELYLFIELLMAYVWVTGLLLYGKVKFDLNIFEPISMITLIYEGIFIIKPIVDLRNQQMTEHRISVLEGGPKATLLFVLAYTIFFLSYYWDHKKLVYAGKDLGTLRSVDQSEIISKLPSLYFAWGIVYALCIYCMMTQGLSLRYIFSFGTEGVRVIDDSNTALLFLSNFGITLITLWLMIFEYSKNKIIIALTTALSLIYILMRNARWLMLVFILAPVVLHYLKRKKQPRLLWGALIGVIGLTIFAWMQSNRAGLASGAAMQTWGLKDLTLENLLAPAESDLSTYRTFYSMVLRYPSQYSYMLGKTFLYAFVLFIPRAIWAGKPDNPVRDMIEHSLNSRARKSGTAVANIGEFYANFGLLGIMFFMYIIGWITSSLKRLVWTSNAEENGLVYIGYSIMYPLFFQWIARGNFSGNIYMTVFAFLPIIVFYIFSYFRR